MTPMPSKGSTMMRERLKDEHGAIAVLAALTIVILLAAVAFVIDISRLYHERQVLQNAVDFGSLAGAQNLPVQGSAQANVGERDRPQRRHRERATGGYVRPYHHVPMRRRRPRRERRPGPGGHPVRLRPDRELDARGGSAKGVGRLIHDCNPFAGEKCNTIRLSTSNSIPYYFAPVIGINTGSTGAVNAASCKGACGAASSPLDVVLVLDRTGSMTHADVANVKNAALSILGFYDSSQQWVGLVALPYGQNCEQVQREQPADLSRYELPRLAGRAAQHGLHAPRRDAEYVERDRPEDQLSGAISHRDGHGERDDPDERRAHEPR